jgi:hypothetical protein
MIEQMMTCGTGISLERNGPPFRGHMNAPLMPIEKYIDYFLATRVALSAIYPWRAWPVSY